MVTKDDALSNEKEIDKLMALISLSFKKICKPTNNNIKTSSNTSRANQDNTPIINRGTGDDTDDEPEDRELKAHYIYMAKIQEVTPDAAENFGPIFDVELGEADQDDDDDLSREQIKKELIGHQETISIMSQEKEAQKKFYKTCEDKEIEKVIALENKVKVLDDIVYKTGQSVQTMNMLNRNCKTSFIKPEFLKKAQRANSRLYDIEKFHLCLKEEMVDDLIYFNSFENKIESLQSQLETQRAEFLNEIDRLFKEYYYVDHMNAILGVYTKLDEVTNLQCTVKFKNDQITSILGYGDLVQGNVIIKKVYYVEGMNHNLSFVGQFCVADLDVAFQKSTCYIRDLKGNDIFTGSRGTNLYSITL
nr:integrase, catalytic region, zinc finger, CCHC-type, peptidase aspartic, catalytic [Tanacetum cinerariifolium]GEV89495.1 integrase, catalytic region, zinc finger, CCHC-type, peptidase aspartic, catalytic [Tanacetum cinerariifolium]GEW11908.1 integrase, catalytic region, zinc finger, CCHC-type, peptidase aspartic, catalytic [Tanacetum cinerariifolium]GEW47495.1 integrase, catalytic region, zinc finger, CCHC-type, peptidase aspartic, catalytic [Tanacetum cinerariifolium]GEW54137.1 integrase, c